MNNTPYNNIVIQAALNDVLNTKLNARTLMAVDTQLAENEGMLKRINRYDYTGYVEHVAEGQGNTQTSSITHTPYNYEVKVYQQRFVVSDEELMTDGKVLDFGISAAADTMVKHLNAQYMAEIQKTQLQEDYAASGMTYSDIVDAIEKLAMEDESSLYLVASTALRAAIRKDDSFVAARQGEIIFSGQIGFIAGIPVIISKLIPKGEAFVADKEAVRLFVKKDSEVAQERDEDKRLTSYFFRRVGLVALMNGTKVVRLAAANTAVPTITTALKATKIVAGACVAKCDFIDVYVNGELVASGSFDPADTDAYSITVPANLVPTDKVKVFARPAGKIGVISDEFTVVA